MKEFWRSMTRRRSDPACLSLDLLITDSFFDYMITSETWYQPLHVIYVMTRCWFITYERKERSDSHKFTLWDPKRSLKEYNILRNDSNCFSKGPWSEKDMQSIQESIHLHSSGESYVSSSNQLMANK
jgi:hypothetical protein